MITCLNIRTEYGKQGTTGINIVSETELRDDGSNAYAHSMEQAIAWVKSQALFANVEPYDLKDGRFVFSSAWTEAPILSMLYGAGETHQRQVITLYPVNTIFENAGYK